MDPTSQRLACQQADHAAAITALRAVRERLRGQRISARADDPEALARVAFMLVDITVAVMLRERQEAGRTEDEARADAIEWLEAQVAHTEIEMLESGVVFNPATSVLGYGVPGEADRQLPPCPGWARLPITTGPASSGQEESPSWHAGTPAEIRVICLPAGGACWVLIV